MTKLGKNEERILKVLTLEKNPQKTSEIAKKLRLDVRAVRGSAKRLVIRGLVRSYKKGNNLYWQPLKKKKVPHKININFISFFWDEKKQNWNKGKFTGEFNNKDRLRLKTNNGIMNLEVEINKEGKKILYLDLIKVDKKYRGKGIGNELFNTMNDLADKHNMIIETLARPLDREPIPYGTKTKDIIKIQKKELVDLVKTYEQYGFNLENEFEVNSIDQEMIRYPKKPVYQTYKKFYPDLTKKEIKEKLKLKQIIKEKSKLINTKDLIQFDVWEITKDQYEKSVPDRDRYKSLLQFGYDNWSPIIIDDNNLVVDGYHRLALMKYKLHKDKIPTININDLTKEEHNFILNG